MAQFCNMQTFINNSLKNSLKNDEAFGVLVNLSIFTSCSKIDRWVWNKIPLKNRITKVVNDGKEYRFKYNGKEYPFSLFSDRELQKFDKGILKDIKRRIEKSTSRTLKLACSMDLINPRIAIGKSIYDSLHLIILFEENATEKVIDYTENLVMKKSDYYEISQFQEINVVNKLELYDIYYILNILDDYEHIYEYLIFTKEIFNELSKKEEFKFLTQKYNNAGMNRHNILLCGTNSDVLFFQKEDFRNVKYEDIRKELDEFTKSGIESSQYIHYDTNKNHYILRKREFGFFTFNLFSTFIPDEEIKKELLSNERYHHCHTNAIIVARSLPNVEKSLVYVVSGKIKENEIDYVYHSWVEIDDEEIVIDYNHNVIMNRNKFYKLYGAIAINKTSALEFDEIISTIFETGLNVNSIQMNYLGLEILNELKRNEKVFQKK